MKKKSSQGQGHIPQKNHKTKLLNGCKYFIIIFWIRTQELNIIKIKLELVNQPETFSKLKEVPPLQTITPLNPKFKIK